MTINMQTVGMTIGGSILFGICVHIGWEIGGRLWSAIF